MRENEENQASSLAKELSVLVSDAVSNGNNVIVVTIDKFEETGISDYTLFRSGSILADGDDRVAGINAFFDSDTRSLQLHLHMSAVGVGAGKSSNDDSVESDSSKDCLCGACRGALDVSDWTNDYPESAN